jgi:hypothetical protein
MREVDMRHGALFAWLLGSTTALAASALVVLLGLPDIVALVAAVAVGIAVTLAYARSRGHSLTASRPVEAQLGTALATLVAIVLSVIVRNLRPDELLVVVVVVVPLYLAVLVFANRDAFAATR